MCTMIRDAGQNGNSRRAGLDKWQTGFGAKTAQERCHCAGATWMQTPAFLRRHLKSDEVRSQIRNLKSDLQLAAQSKSRYGLMGFFRVSTLTVSMESFASPI